MMKVIDAIDAEHVIRERLASLERGDPGTPMEDVLADVRATLGIDRTELQ